MIYVILILATLFHCLPPRSIIRAQDPYLVTTSSAPGDPLIDGVHQRIVNLSAVPKSHAEPWADVKSLTVRQYVLADAII